MSGLISTQKQSPPFTPPSHKQWMKNSVSKYNIFIYYIYCIIWSQRWFGALIGPGHTGLLCRKQSWRRSVTGGDKLAAPECCDTANLCVPAPSTAGPGVPGRLLLGHLFLSLNMDSFLTPCLWMYNHKFHWNSLNWVPWSPAQGYEDQNVLNSLEYERKVLGVCSHQVMWELWQILGDWCTLMYRSPEGREGDRVCLADGGWWDSTLNLGNKQWARVF